MGMASFTSNSNQVRNEFHQLSQTFQTLQTSQTFQTLSMGMSGDYQIAIEEGSNLVRIGSLLFGSRS
jgi:uncharacterized pyridoxal phosphate-containing UPF0001 family protein